MTNLRINVLNSGGSDSKGDASGTIEPDSLVSVGV